MNEFLQDEVDQQDIQFVSRQALAATTLFHDYLPNLGGVEYYENILDQIKALELFEKKEFLSENYPLEFEDMHVLVINGNIYNRHTIIHALVLDLDVDLFIYEDLTPEQLVQKDQDLARQKKELNYGFTIVKHIRETGAIDLEFFNELIKEYPEYQYFGHAYRVILLDDKEQFDLTRVKAGTSWALTREGLDKFIAHERSGYQAFIYLEANIYGLNLVRLIKEKFSYIENIREQLKDLVKEDEIIALEILSIHTIDKDFTPKSEHA